MARGFVRRDVQSLRHGARVLERGHLDPMPAGTLRPDAAERNALVGQALVGIVGAQRQTIFGAGSEHAIGLGHPARHEVIDHDAEIPLGAIEHDSRPAPCPRCGVQAGN